MKNLTCRFSVKIFKGTEVKRAEMDIDLGYIPNIGDNIAYNKFIGTVSAIVFDAACFKVFITFNNFNVPDRYEFANVIADFSKDGWEIMGDSNA